MKLKPLLFLAVIWGGLFALVEAGSWMVLKVANARHPSDNPLVTEYLARGHPLFVDNEDLRIQSQEFFYHPFLGYEQARNHVTIRPSPEYTGHIGVDAAGFVHTGDPERNPKRLAEPKGRSYRVVFLGGSTMFGLGSSRNQTTIPAYFEALLHQAWPGVEFLVLNAGVQGYQSTQERVAYELYLDGLEPDLVIALDGTNDAMFPADLAVWKPYFSTTSLVDNARFVSLHKPSVNLASTIQALITFPEPLASLALLRRVISRLPGGPQPRHNQPGIYHPEAAVQLHGNLKSLARQLTSDHRLGLFVLQPYLGHAKPNLTEGERAIVDGYGGRIEVFNRHFSDFAALYHDLDQHFSGSGLLFIDLRTVFSDTPNLIYHSLAHYNDTGNKMLADVMFTRVQADMAADLGAKGLLP